jgi:hypothetical protein
VNGICVAPGSTQWFINSLNNISLFSIGIKTPVTSTETRGGKSTWLCRTRFLTEMAVLLLSPESDLSGKRSLE